MRHSKRNIAGFFLIVLTLLSGLLFINNLVYAWRFHRAIAQGADLNGKIFTGMLKCLNWSAVDVSSVTTFIPFFGFLLMFCGLIRIRHNEDWPFFRSYNQLNVALGLLGTIWGIILVGYFPAGNVTIASLMMCLHTAMFSTLAAVAWVMVLRPLVFDPVMRWIRKSELPDVPEDDSFDKTLDEFLGKLSESGKALEENSKAASTFTQALHSADNALKDAGPAFQRFSDNAAAFHEAELSAIQAFSQSAKDVEALIRSLRIENENLVRQEQVLREEKNAAEHDLAETKAEVTLLKDQLSAREAELNRLNDTLDRIRGVLR